MVGDVERERDIRRGVLMQAFPAPANMFTVPSGEVVDVNSEAKVPGHIVLTRILSLPHQLLLLGAGRDVRR
jgi:hypothetical protein